MKLTGFLKGTGKVGNIVVSMVAGQAIAREYNPNVANPSTLSQVNQRSRLKLASQLAAAVAPVIIIPRNGLQSSRNLFIRKNFGSIYGNGGEAQISYENIQLTNGSAGLPAIEATRSTDGGIVVKLAESADAAVSRVVYVVYKKTSEDQLQYIGSAIQDIAGDDGTFEAAFAYVAGDLIIWAYGMKDLSGAASAKYGDYNIATGEDVARLQATRKLSTADFQFTQTRGITLFSGENATINPSANQVMVYITASGNGEVSGTGFVNGRKAVDVGTSVTVVATPAEGSTFVNWMKQGTNNIVSTSATYTFTADAQTDLIATFNTPSEGGGGFGGGD